MKKNVVTVFLAAGLLSVILGGCQDRAGQAEIVPAETMPEDTMPGKTEPGKTGPEETALENNAPEETIQPKAEAGDGVSPYQFVKEYGIMKSEHPIYMLDPDTEQELTREEITLHSIFAIQQDQELIVSAVLDDRSEIPQLDAGEAVQGGLYHELSDGTKISSVRYQEALWDSGEGMVLTGPGIPEEGYRPDETQNLKASYVAYYDFYETYGYMRYFLEAKFQLPSTLDFETDPDGYSVRVLDLDCPVQLSMVRAPGYGTLEELAKGEGGDIDTHGDFSVISMGEALEDGIAISLYVCSNAGEQTASVIHIPPQQFDKIDLPTLSAGENSYPLRRQDSANALIDRMGLYRLEGENQDGKCRRYLFEVPSEELNGPFTLTIPGLTLPSGEVSEPVTLPIPNDSEMLTEEIPFQNGTVRLLKITRMEEMQEQVNRVNQDNQDNQENRDSQATVTSINERPAVYLDVEAASDMGEAALRGLLCQKQGATSGWENQRYDFDDNGNLSGFRIYYDEGDTRVTLRFLSLAIYWEQPFITEVLAADP